MAFTHIEQHLQKAMDQIQEKILSMAQKVEFSLRQSLQALISGDGRIAYSVVLQDKAIDELEKEIDWLCLEFLVKQSPVAKHLRFVYAAIKINQDLERIGDYAESIARQSLVVHSLKVQIDFGLYEKIANATIPLLPQVMQAFIQSDQELAWKTMAEEEQANEIRDLINSDLYRLREQNQIPLQALTPLQTIARRFERAADQCKNIGEEVLYMCTGKNVKHAKPEVFRILFVDQGNSCLSQMAEIIGFSLGHPEFTFSSAGIHPQAIDPALQTFLQSKHLDLGERSPKSVREITNTGHYQVIVAFGKDAKQTFPPPPTKTVGIEWDLPDPSQFQGPDSEKMAQYESTFQFLKHQIENLVGAILGTSKSDKQ